jgi:hypothetical protein
MMIRTDPNDDIKKKNRPLRLCGQEGTARDSAELMRQLLQRNFANHRESRVDQMTIFGICSKVDFSDLQNTLIKNKRSLRVICGGRFLVSLNFSI